MEAPPPSVRAALANVHEEVTSRYYGCGLVAPDLIAGARILDLGSGSGQDAYVLAQLVGESGNVTGVDATPEQLAVAQAHEDWHRETFGYAQPNVRFLKGDIERLGDIDLEPGSFDVIVSNCVINLVADKAAVFAAAYDLLKPGGELYFSDVYSDRRVPEALKDDPVLHGECLSGALYWGDFQNLARAAGFRDPRLVTCRPLGITNAGIEAKLAGFSFASVTTRLFKLPSLEPACEDYGEALCYKGGMPGAGHAFALDADHLFEAGRVVPVCGNTADLIINTRFRNWFDYIGDRNRHFGGFSGCAATQPFGGETLDSTVLPASCC